MTIYEFVLTDKNTGRELIQDNESTNYALDSFGNVIPLRGYYENIMLPKPEDIIPRLYSGFQDSQSKNIYDGDVLIIEGLDRLFYAAVNFAEGNFCVVSRHIPYGCVLELKKLNIAVAKVAGNIYEERFKEQEF